MFDWLLQHTATGATYLQAALCIVGLVIMAYLNVCGIVTMYREVFSKEARRHYEPVPRRRRVASAWRVEQYPRRAGAK